MSIKTFIRNLKYLFQHSIREGGNKAREAALELCEIRQKIERLCEREQACILPILTYAEHMYRREPSGGALDKPEILSSEATLQELLQTTKSLVRYGEEELLLGEGGVKGVISQAPDERLSKRLRAILHSDEGKVLLCVPPSLWYEAGNHGRPEDWDPRFEMRLRARRVADRSMLRGKPYGNAYAPFSPETSEHYKRWRQLWEGKELVMICGEHAFDGMEYNIFDNARKIEYLHLPPRNAFAAYDAVLARARRMAADKMALISAGAMGTVLAYDLSVRYGIRALDVGSLAAKYDMLMRASFRNRKA